MIDSDTEGHFPELLFMKHTAIKITMAIIRTSAFQAGKKGSDYKHRIVLQAALAHCLSLKISKKPGICMLMFSVPLAFSLIHHANASGLHIFGISNPSAIITRLHGF